MTKDQIQKDPGYLRLTAQQKLFVDAMMDNGGDKVEAAVSAYKCKDRYSAISIASKLMRHLIISRLLDAFFGQKPSDRIPTREEIAAAAWERAINSADEPTAIKWFALTGRYLGYDKGEEAEPKPKPAETKAKDDALIAELEKRGL